MNKIQKLIAIILSIIFIGLTAYYFILYNQASLILGLEQAESQKVEDSTYLLPNTPNTLERYKIINIIYDTQHVYAILHLDNGNIKVLEITEAYIDPALKNINEGYLYRDNMQIYIRPE